MVDAEVLTGSAENKPMAYQLALTSRITLIEGRLLPYEDLLEMDAEDLSFLGTHFPEKYNYVVCGQ
jgi:hypothetical protein